MKILVVNGSPKGDYSVTLQTVLFWSKLYPEHEFDYLNVGKSIKKFEKDFSQAKEKLNWAQLILFSYPVYTFIAPYQLHRFIEMVKDFKIDISGKFAAQLTTSKHFYDITAHKYIEDNCADLGLKYVGGLSADMEDLLSEKGRLQAKDFFEYICFCVSNNIVNEIKHLQCEFAPIMASVPPIDGTQQKDGDVVIVTNCAKDDSALQSMIDRFTAVCKRQTRLINIADFPFQGGCLGCFNCAVDGKCIYKDGFDGYLRNEIQTAQAIIYAFTIKDHSMGASFKLYDDRQFCNGHRTVTMGMPFGYLVNGALSIETNLITILEARAQVGGNYLAGIATNESDPDKAIDDMAEKLEYALTKEYMPPQNFYGIGGMKVFRDLIWQMQGMMKADHKFYKKHKQYDFPQRHWPKMLAMYLVGAMLSNQKIKRKMGNKMNEGMLMPYKKVLNQIEK